MKESSMKKFAVIGLSLLAVLLVSVSLAAAQEPVDDGAPVAPGVNFIDEDGDGQCDLYGTDQAGNGRAGAGQGYCSRGNGAAGANFVDENGDGICDLAGSDQAGGGQGFGQQGRGGNGSRGGAGNGLGRGMGQGSWGVGAAQ